MNDIITKIENAWEYDYNFKVVCSNYEVNTLFNFKYLTDKSSFTQKEAFYLHQLVKAFGYEAFNTEINGKKVHYEGKSRNISAINKAASALLGKDVALDESDFE